MKIFAFVLAFSICAAVMVTSSAIANKMNGKNYTTSDHNMSNKAKAAGKKGN